MEPIGFRHVSDLIFKVNIIISWSQCTNRLALHQLKLTISTRIHGAKQNKRTSHQDRWNKHQSEHQACSPMEAVNWDGRVLTLFPLTSENVWWKFTEEQPAHILHQPQIIKENTLIQYVFIIVVASCSIFSHLVVVNELMKQRHVITYSSDD